MLYYLFGPLGKQYLIFNLFNYLSFRAAGAMVTALLIAFLVGPGIIRRLRDFVSRFPPGCPAAFEFRHVSWFDDEVYAALREGGAALCIAESGEAIDTPFVPTAEWGYLRLRREDYDDAALERWAARLREAPWSRAFVFFKHEDAGAGPRLAARFREIFERD